MKLYISNIKKGTLDTLVGHNFVLASELIPVLKQIGHHSVYYQVGICESLPDKRPVTIRINKTKTSIEVDFDEDFYFGSDEISNYMEAIANVTGGRVAYGSFEIHNLFCNRTRARGNQK